MALSENEKKLNDMTHTGKFCPNCPDHEMEQVSKSEVYVCHWCGGQFEIKEGEVKDSQFEGFK